MCHAMISKLVYYLITSLFFSFAKFYIGPLVSTLIYSGDQITEKKTDVKLEDVNTLVFNYI